MSTHLLESEDLLSVLTPHTGRHTALLGMASKRIAASMARMRPPPAHEFHFDAGAERRGTERERRDGNLALLDRQSRRFSLTAIELPGFVLDPSGVFRQQDARGGPRLAAVLARCPALRRLSLRGANVWRWTEIALALGACTKLEEVDLSETSHVNATGTNGADGTRNVAVWEGLARCPALRELDVHGCGLRMEAESLGRMLLACTRLERLNLAGNALQEDLSAEPDYEEDAYHMHRIGLALATCGRLEHLDLSRNGLDGTCVEFLENLPLCTRLASLSLAHNRFERVGARHVARVLERTGSLRRLDMAGNPLTVHGVCNLLGGEWAQLTHLDLSECGVGAGTGSRAAQQRVADALAACETLEELELSRNALGDAFTHVLVGALTRSAALRGLGLASVDATERAWGAPGSGAWRGGCAHLVRLDLTGNEWTAAGKQALRRAWTRAHGEGLLLDA